MDSKRDSHSTDIDNDKPGQFWDPMKDNINELPKSRWIFWAIWSPKLGEISRRLKRSDSLLIKLEYFNGCLDIIRRLGLLIPSGEHAIRRLTSETSDITMAQVVHKLNPQSLSDRKNAVRRVAVQDLFQLDQGSTSLIAACEDLAELLGLTVREGDILLVKKPLSLDHDQENMWLNHREFRTESQVVLLINGETDSPADFREPFGKREWKYENLVQKFYAEGDGEGKDPCTLLRIVPLSLQEHLKMPAFRPSLQHSETADVEVLNFCCFFLNLLLAIISSIKLKISVRPVVTNLEQIAINFEPSTKLGQMNLMCLSKHVNDYSICLTNKRTADWSEEESSSAGARLGPESSVDTSDSNTLDITQLVQLCVSQVEEDELAAKDKLNSALADGIAERSKNIDIQDCGTTYAVDKLNKDFSSSGSPKRQSSSIGASDSTSNRHLGVGTSVCSFLEITQLVETCVNQVVENELSGNSIDDRSITEGGRSRQIDTKHGRTTCIVDLGEDYLAPDGSLNVKDSEPGENGTVISEEQDNKSLTPADEKPDDIYDSSQNESQIFFTAPSWE